MTGGGTSDVSASKIETRKSLKTRGETRKE